MVCWSIQIGKLHEMLGKERAFTSKFLLKNGCPLTHISFVKLKNAYEPALREHQNSLDMVNRCWLAKLYPWKMVRICTPVRYHTAVQFQEQGHLLKKKKKRYLKGWLKEISMHFGGQTQENLERCFLWS